MVAFAARRVKKRAPHRVTSRWIAGLLLFVCFGRTPEAGAAGDSIGPQERLPRARVIVIENPRSVVAFSPVADVVEEMVRRGIVSWTGKENAAEGWRSLVSAQDVIGIKVVSAPGATSGTRPVVAAAVVKSLLEAGIPAKRIVLWDKRLSDLRKAGFVALAEQLGVEVAGSMDEGFDPQAFYDTALLGNLVWGDLQFGKKGDDVGRKSYVSKLLTQRLTKIIHVTPLLNHNLAAVTGNLYSLAMGSVDNTIRFEAGSAVQLEEAVPELYAMPEIGDRVVLSIVDALICQYQGAEKTLLHRSTMLGQLRFSTDPVALDVLSILELNRQRERAGIPRVRVRWQLYSNASLLELGISNPQLIDLIKVTP